MRANQHMYLESAGKFTGGLEVTNLKEVNALIVGGNCDGKEISMRPVWRME